MSWTISEKIGMTLQATANVLKKKDHTTIMSGCKKIKTIGKKPYSQ